MAHQQRQVTTIRTVRWHYDLISGETPPPDETNLKGAITVKDPLTANFSFFFVGGIAFLISIHESPVTVDFSYSGPLPVRKIQDLVTAGAQVRFATS
jgi:hypothetical protein